MTEMSPLGTTGNLLKKHAELPLEKRLDVQAKQGRTVYGVEIKITDDEGKEPPRDGKAFGDVKVRGPWITAGYFKGEGRSEEQTAELQSQMRKSYAVFCWEKKIKTKKQPV